MFIRSKILFFMMGLALCCHQNASAEQDKFSHFIGLKSFSKFTASKNEAGEKVLLSPTIKAPLSWNQLIVSWNAEAPTGTFLKIEARGIYPNHSTKFYNLGEWSSDNQKFPRKSSTRQKDEDGSVNVDTLNLIRTGADVQLRLTLNSVDKKTVNLKFIGLSFAQTKGEHTSLPPNRAAWGKIINTPERSQLSYPQEKGWCSPTSLTMVLNRWSQVLHRPDMSLDVPEVAAGVYDQGWEATGNWPFNAAYAGSFKGMRAYVTRFRDISELEDWIEAGIPVIISSPWQLLQDGRTSQSNGHLVTCIGFTETGDVVINDPATNLQRGDSVRHIYKRANVINAWEQSHNTVYLVYPENAKVPKDRFGHWYR